MSYGDFHTTRVVIFISTNRYTVLTKNNICKEHLSH